MQALKLTKKYEKYPEYKDSGVEWLGKVPKNWKISKVKDIFNLIKERSFNNSEAEVLSLTLNGIKIRDISNNEGQIASSYEGYRRINKGDIVLNPMDLVRGFVDASKFEGIISPAYSTLRKKKQTTNSQFFNYLFQKNYFEGVFYPFGNGVSTDHRWTLKDDTLLNFPILAPSEKEQTTISEYIDDKVVSIDQIIEKKQKLIELLKDKRATLISNVITKGLDSKTEFIKTGVTNFEQIPKGWILQKMKFLARKPFQYGANEAGLNDDRSQPRFIRITDIDEIGNLRGDTFKSLDLELAKPYLLEEGDVLFARTGGTVGKSFKYKKEWGPCCYAGYLIRMSVNQKKISSDYLNYVTKSDYYWKWINSIFIRSTIQNVSAEKYKDFLIALPSLKEQQEILHFLNKKIPIFENGIKSVEKSILLLQELKASLISNVVTGKIKV
jgi:type I restriction enzyme S subunit